MSTILKILMLEDCTTDAEIVQRLLKKEGLDFEFCLALNKEAFLLALDRLSPDIILADNSLPQFNAKDALEIVHGRALQIPFILVTGSVSEEFAADIIKLGADDYILKDRLARLPAAIDAAIKQHRGKKEREDAFQEIRRSNERFQTLSKATQDAVWDWNLLTGDVWWNESFFNLLGYDPKLPVPDLHKWTKRIHPADRGKVLTRLEKIRETSVQSWEDEFRFQLADGSYGTVMDRSYILRDDSGKPVRVICALVDITTDINERQRMEKERLTSKIEQQKEVTRAILRTQEMDRNDLGRELHDNINQILASVNLKLGYYLEEPKNNIYVIENCRENLQKAIQEARNLSHHMVMPRFSESSLQNELKTLVENYTYENIVRFEISKMQEEDIPSAIKETLYRIMQEQLSNIYKHAKADKVVIKISNDPHRISLVIQDNGIGFDMQQKRKGIGIDNIFNRVESYNGTSDIISEPAKGCTLSVSIPF